MARCARAEAALSAFAHGYAAARRGSMSSSGARVHTLPRTGVSNRLAAAADAAGAADSTTQAAATAEPLRLSYHGYLRVIVDVPNLDALRASMTNALKLLLRAIGVQCNLASSGVINGSFLPLVLPTLLW
eukprot:6192584-Pleurochrysis_carterae.AAC.1